MGLWDAAMIKDNHVLVAGGVAEAVRRYAERFRQPEPREDRVALEITVDRVLGRA